jgi:hypothetical protein
MGIQSKITNSERKKYPFDELVRPLGYFICVAIGLVVLVWCLHGDLRSLPSLLRSQPIDFVVLDAPGAVADRGVVKRLSVRNLSFQSVDIMGVQSSCEVNAFRGAHTTVAPMGVAEIPLWMGTGKDNKKPNILLYTSMADFPHVIDVGD